MSAAAMATIGGCGRDGAVNGGGRRDRSSL
jgi:hypothetical protein